MASLDVQPANVKRSALTWARSLSLDRSAKAVLCALASRAKDGMAWPSHKMLAADVSCSVNTVLRALRRLYAAGLIERQDRFAANGRRTANGYLLNLGSVGGIPRNLQGYPPPHHEGVPSPSACGGYPPHGEGDRFTELTSEDSRRKKRTVETAALESPPTSVRASCAQEREAEDSKTDRQKHVLLAERILKLTASRAERYYQKAVESYGRETINEGLAKMDLREEGGEVFRNPQAVLAMICDDIKNKPKPPKPRIPIGAIDLGNGQYLSRWG